MLDFKEQSYAEKIIELGEKLARIEERLLSPERTVDDLIEHMQIVKQLRLI